MQDLSPEDKKIAPKNYQIAPENYPQIIFRCYLVGLSPVGSPKIT